MENSIGQVVGQLKREVGVLRLQLGDLKFYTEDFRENHLQIAARLMTNVELLNMEAGGIERNRRAIDDVSNRVGALEGMMQRMLVFLGIEEKEVCECGRSSVLVHNTGLGSSTMISHEIQTQTLSTAPVTHTVPTQQTIAKNDIQLQTNIEGSEQQKPVILPPTQKMLEKLGDPHEN